MLVIKIFRRKNILFFISTQNEEFNIATFRYI